MPEIDDCICKLVREEYREDFKQELFLILLEIPCDRVVQMNGTFKYFVVRIILNLARQKKNEFHKKYLDRSVEYNTDKLNYQVSSPADVDTMGERIEREKREESILMQIPGIDKALGHDSFPYHEVILSMITKLGSMRKVSIETGIPATTLRRTVLRIREHLQK